MCLEEAAIPRFVPGLHFKNQGTKCGYRSVTYETKLSRRENLMADDKTALEEKQDKSLEEQKTEEQGKKQDKGAAEKEQKPDQEKEHKKDKDDDGNCCGG
jgi:hypothetical protein